MPWCPVCKYEYKDGFAVCADCGASLVESLDEDIDNSDDILSEDDLVEDNLTIDDDIIGEQKELSPEEVMKMVAPKKNTIQKAEVFVKASDRAENYKSSGGTLIFVGLVGIIFLLLCYFQIVKVSFAPNIDIMFYAVMGLMFIAFVVIGFKTLSQAKAIKEWAKDEDELTERIYSFFKDNHDAKSIDLLINMDESIPLSDEEKFFPRSNVIRSIIAEQFGELDDSYLTELTETVYAQIFEG